MMWLIRYGTGRPGGNREIIEAETRRDAARYAADHAHGWGYEVTKIERSEKK